MYRSIGGKPPKGILLEGDPGTGEAPSTWPLLLCPAQRHRNRDLGTVFRLM